MPSATIKKLKNILICTSLIAMTACASVDKETGVINEDPYEDANRVMFAFNKTVDDYFLHPIASGYVTVVPNYGRERVSNVLTNLKMPVIFVNSVLQGDAQNAFSALWSFILNSTLGVAGIFDFASANTTLKVSPEDFGQTLGVWGADQGAYIILPLLGPSSSRDTVGFAADWVSDPFNYANNTFVYSRTALGAVDKRAGLLNILDDVYKTSLDPYATIRSAYLQQRRAAVKNTHEDVSR